MSGGPDPPVAETHKPKELDMLIAVNRILDVAASYAVVFLGLALAGATAAVGA